MDALFLSRIQFGFVISFHIIFPALSIGLASWLMFLEWRWLRTRDALWWQLYQFWLKVFAISFGMGVVSGIVMSFQFGTNWARLSEHAGAVIGPLLSYEVLTAFFLEAGFLGVMLFGAKRVSPGVHFFATAMVALGTLISTFWIIAAISWMHTPQGHLAQGGVLVPGDWAQIIFNPSFFHRLPHMVLAAFISTCFVIGGTAAWYVRRGVHPAAAARMLRLAVAFGAIAVPLQILVGDQHGLNTLEHQPIKVSAIEGHWHAPANPADGIPLLVFAVPRQDEARNDYEIAIPHLGSLILTHTWAGQIPPLTSVPAEDRPPVLPVFYAFRVMVGIGVLMLLVVAASAWAWWRGRLEQSVWTLRGWQLLSATGFVALIAGWWVTEIGRQPWVVYGLLRTRDAVSPVLQAGEVAASLAGYATVYAVIFGAGIVYLWRLLRQGPQAQADAAPGGAV